MDTNTATATIAPPGGWRRISLNDVARPPAPSPPDEPDTGLALFEATLRRALASSARRDALAHDEAVVASLGQLVADPALWAEAA